MKNKYFNFDISYYVSGSMWLMIPEALVLAKAFALSILYANLLEMETYGYLRYFIILLEIAMIICLPGMRSAVVKSIAQGRDGIYQKAILSTMKWSLLGSLLFIIYYIIEPVIFSNNRNLIYIILAICFPIYSISNYYIEYFLGRKMFSKIAYIKSSFNILLFIFTLIVILYYPTPEVLFLVNIISQILVLGFFSIFYVKKHLRNNKVDYLDKLLGKKISFGHSISLLAGKVDSLFITYFLGYDELAIYSIISLIPNQFKKIGNVITPLFLPEISTDMPNKIQAIKRFIFLIILISFLVIAYSICAKYFFSLFYIKYYDYVWLSILLSLSFIVFPISYLEQILIAKGNYIFFNYMKIIISILLIIGSFILIFYHGLVGAVINRVTIRIIGLILHLYFTLKSYQTT